MEWHRTCGLGRPLYADLQKDCIGISTAYTYLIPITYLGYLQAQAAFAFYVVIISDTYELHNTYLITVFENGTQKLLRRLENYEPLTDPSDLSVPYGERLVHTKVISSLAVINAFISGRGANERDPGDLFR